MAFSPDCLESRDNVRRRVLRLGSAFFPLLLGRAGKTKAYEGLRRKRREWESRSRVDSAFFGHGPRATTPSPCYVFARSASNNPSRSLTPTLPPFTIGHRLSPSLFIYPLLHGRECFGKHKATEKDRDPRMQTPAVRLRKPTEIQGRERERWKKVGA